MGFTKCPRPNKMVFENNLKIMNNISLANIFKLAKIDHLPIAALPPAHKFLICKAAKISQKSLYNHALALIIIS